MELVYPFIFHFDYGKVTVNKMSNFADEPLVSY